MAAAAWTATRPTASSRSASPTCSQPLASLPTPSSDLREATCGFAGSLPRSRKWLVVSYPTPLRRPPAEQNEALPPPRHPNPAGEDVESSLLDLHKQPAIGSAHHSEDRPSIQREQLIERFCQTVELS